MYQQSIPTAIMPPGRTPGIWLLLIDSDSLSAPLKFMYSRMSPRASHRRHPVIRLLASSPGSFDSRLFGILVQNVSKTSDSVKMAYFRKCALKKWGQVFTRVGLLVNLYSVSPLRRAFDANHCPPRAFDPPQEIGQQLHTKRFRNLFHSFRSSARLFIDHHAVVHGLLFKEGRSESCIATSFPKLISKQKWFYDIYY